MLSDVQRTALHQLLVKRQNMLIPQVGSHFDLGQAFQQTTGELSHYDNHPGDQGTELYEREKDMALAEHAEEELEAINKALYAMDEGSYGICIVCGDDIPYERLVAVPTTETCLDHAKDTQLHPNLPVETQANFGQIVRNREETTSVYFDGADAWQQVSEYGTSDTPSDYLKEMSTYQNVSSNEDEQIGYVEAVENIETKNIEGINIASSTHLVEKERKGLIR